MNVHFLSLHDVTRAIFVVLRSCSCLGSSIWRVICFSVYCYSKYAFTWRNQLAPGWCGCNSTWWRHQMGTFSALLDFCEGSPPVTVTFPHKGQWRGALMFSLIFAWTNGWVNNGDAGDLSRRRAHYDVTVMNLCFQTHYVFYLLGSWISSVLVISCECHWN